MKVFLIFAFFPAIFASQRLNTDEPLSLVYRARAGKDREPIGATLKLDCRYGESADQYKIDVAAIDEFIRSEKSSIQVVDANGNTNQQVGSGDLTIKGYLKDLELGARDKQCDGEAGLLCGAVHRGSLLVRQFIVVPGSESQLHWTGFFKVAFECRLAPIDPDNVALNYDMLKPEEPLDQCKEFTHSATSTKTADGYLLNIDLRRNNYFTNLDNCVLKTTSGLVTPFLQNGRILNVPEMTVTGRVVTQGRAYQLTLKDLTFPNGVHQAEVSCQVAYCRTAAAGHPTAPRCVATTTLPHEAVSRTQFKALRAAAPSLKADQSIDIKMGRVSLIVSSPVRRAGNTECPWKKP